MSSAATRTLEVLDDRVQLAAAIATHFDPMAVPGAASLPEDERAGAIDGLATVCDEVEVAGSGYRHWAMRPEARRLVLQTMGTRPDFTSLVESIEAPPGDLFATYLRDGLRGEDLGLLLPPTGAIPAPGTVDLDCLLRAARFLEGLPGVRTDTGDLERRLRRQIALTEQTKALEAVAPRRLVGRELEYAALRAYRATVLPTEGDWVPSFVLVGPGGVGKSALVSTFVSDQRREAGAAPLIYLDFDRATLIGATPLDLTFELTRQLGLADVALEQRLEEFRERTRKLLGGQESTGIDVSGGASSAAQRDLASLLSGWPHRSSPVTIVFDTFEEVAIRGVTAVRDALQWVADLRSAVQLPQLHLIVCGRAVLPDTPHVGAHDVAAMFNMHRQLTLEDLPASEAVELLIVLGVDPALAQRLPPVFGGNPLVLKLLHRFVTTNDADEIDQLIAEGTNARQDAPSGEVGLRFVYERILNRIKKPRVKALAYPGVVLRRVTPELILKVLAPTCPVPLDVKTPADAQQAFNELAEHVWLVTRIAPDTVVHRADVRRLLVPGLEHSNDVDTRAIHVAAARYYAERPASVPEDVATIERIYHLGLLDDLPENLPEGLAQEVVRQLAADIEYWPVRSRARVKSLAGRHIELTEEEVSTLEAPRQVRTRGYRLEKGLESSDMGSAAFEEAQLGLLGQGEDTMAAIPDSRWRLLFDRGDFEFMSESSRVLTAYDRYFTADPSSVSSGSPTHEHPWFIALAILLVERGERPVFSETALAALDSGWDDARRYGAALAALTGDERAHARITGRGSVFPSRLDLSRIDDVVVCQAAASGDLDDHPTTFQMYSYDFFRLSHVAAIATAAGDTGLADRISSSTEEYATRRPDTRELNDLRATLASSPLNLEGARALRAAPTTLSFLYGAIRTIVTPLDRTSLLALVRDLEQRSVLWPQDLTASALDSTLRSTITPGDVTALIEMADRCGLIVDLIDAVSARATTRLSLRLAAGIRRIEGLLFPFARPRAELPSVH